MPAAIWEIHDADKNDAFNRNLNFLANSIGPNSIENIGNRQQLTEWAREAEAEPVNDNQV